MLRIFLAAVLLLAATDTDRVFVGRVSQDGAYEIEASRFALIRASAQTVKSLARTEVHDHEFVAADLKRISAANDVPIAPQLNAEFAMRLAKLKSSTGPAFDAAYIEDMKQIHDKDEKLFLQESNDGSDAFRRFASATDLLMKRHIAALNSPEWTVFQPAKP